MPLSLGEIFKSPDPGKTVHMVGRFIFGWLGLGLAFNSILLIIKMITKEMKKRISKIECKSNIIKLGDIYMITMLMVLPLTT